MKLVFVVGLVILAFSGLNASELSLKGALGMPEADELDTVDIDVKNSLIDVARDLAYHLLSTRGLVKDADECALGKTLELLIANKTHISKDLATFFTIVKKLDTFKHLSQLIDQLLGHGNNTNSFVGDKEIVEELSKRLLQEITSPKGLKKIRDYVEGLASKSKLEVVHALRELLNKLDDSKLKMALSSLLGGSNMSNLDISQIWQVVKDLARSFGLQVITKLAPLRDWIVSKWSDIKVKLSGKVSLIKGIAEEILDSGTVISVTVAQEAKSLFARYKKSLGDLYEPLMKELQGIVSATTEAPVY